MNQSVKCTAKRLTAILAALFVLLSCVSPAAAVSPDWDQLEIALAYFDYNGNECSVIAEPVYDREGCFLAVIDNAPFDGIMINCYHPSHNYEFVPANGEILQNVTDSQDRLDETDSVLILAYEDDTEESFFLYISSNVINSEYAESEEEYAEPEYTEPEEEYTEPEYTEPEEEYTEPEYTEPAEEYTEPEYTEPEEEYTEPEYTEPEEEYTEPEYTEPAEEYTEPAYTEPEEEYTEPEYTEPEEEYTEPEYTEPVEEHTEPEYTEPEEEYTEPEYTEPEEEYTEPEYTEPEEEYTEPEYTEPGDEYTEPEYIVPDEEQNTRDDDVPSEEAIPVGMPVNRFGTTNTNKVNYRGAPGKSGEALGQIKNKGAYVYILKELYNDMNERWMHILYNGQECYVMSDFVTMLPQELSDEYMLTLPTPVPEYSTSGDDTFGTDIQYDDAETPDEIEPETDASIIPDSVAEPQYDPEYTEGMTDYAAPVYEEEKQEAVSEEYGQEQDVEQDTVPTEGFINRFGTTNIQNLNYRKTPDKSGKVLGQIKKPGTKVYVISRLINGNGDNWSYILYNDTECYVKSEYITMMSQTESDAYMATLGEPIVPYTELPEDNSDTADETGNDDNAGAADDIAGETPTEEQPAQQETGSETETDIVYDDVPAEAEGTETGTGTVDADTDTVSVPETEADVLPETEKTDDGVELPSETDGIAATETGDSAETALPSETDIAPEAEEEKIPVGAFINRFGQTVVANVNCRDASNKNGKAVWQIKKAGTKVYLIKETINDSGEFWMYVLYNGKECYIKSEFVEMLNQTESDAYMATLDSPVAPYRDEESTITEDSTADTDAEQADDGYTTDEDSTEKETLESADSEDITDVQPESVPESEQHVPAETAADDAADGEEEKIEETAQPEDTAADDEIPAGALINRFGEINKANTNRRKTPSKSGKAIEKFKKGAKVYLIREVVNDAGERWMEILFNGDVCYVMSEFVDVMSQAESDSYMAKLKTPVPPVTEQTAEEDPDEKDTAGVTDSPESEEARTAAETAMPDETTAEPVETEVAEPTENPTDVPTENPTDVPTETPTEAPTEAPTETPTEVPTEVPTENPTEAPTETPTEAPTETPTEVPTEVPTENPTEAPTAEFIPDETATQKPAAYDGWAIMAHSADLMTGNSISDESVMAVLPAGTIVYVNRQDYDVYDELWDIVTTLENLTGMVYDSDLRHISDEEAETLISQWKDANATPEPTAEPVSTPEPRQISGYAATIADGIYVRNYPNSSSVIIDELPANKIVYVTGQIYTDGNPWHEVLYDDEYGYIRADMLRMLSDRETEDYIEKVNATEEPEVEWTPQPYDDNMMSSYGYVSAKTVNFRKEPKTSSTRIRQLKQYAFCLVIGSEQIDDTLWYKIVYDGNTGYVSGDYFRQMTISELDEFLASDDYLKGISDNSRTGTDQIAEEADASGVIIAAEDQKVSVWTNPNSGLNVSYQPFDPFATPEPITTPEPAETEEPTDEASSEPSSTPEETILPDPLATTKTNYNTEENEDNASPIGGIILGGIAVLGLGGAGYAWYVHTQNKRRAAQRAAQRKAHQARQAANNGKGNSQDAVPAVTASQVSKVRTGTYSERNGTATPVPGDTRANVGSQLKPYGKTIENPYGRYTSKSGAQSEQKEEYTATFRPENSGETAGRRTGRRSDRYNTTGRDDQTGK